MVKGKIFLFSILVIFLCSCRSSYKITDPYGVQSKIRLQSGDVVSGELLLLNSDTLHYVVGNTVYATQLSNISWIRARGLEAKGRDLWVGLSGLPSLAIAAIDDVDAGVRVAFGVAGISALLIAAYGPSKSKIRDPFGPEDLAKINRYTRYPQGLTTEEYMDVLSVYLQKNPVFLVLREEK